jgi:hypothetical protein
LINDIIFMPLTDRQLVASLALINNGKYQAACIQTDSLYKVALRHADNGWDFLLIAFRPVRGLSTEP